MGRALTLKSERLHPAARQAARVKPVATGIWLRRGIWIYIGLIFLEGALRKWVLPGLATPLLVVRDPVALGILFLALRKGYFPGNLYAFAALLIAIIGFFTALFVGHGNLFVGLYGARILILHFPLLFVIGRVLNRDDVVQAGKWLLLLSIPMTLLIALQFYSSQSAWVNRGIGGDAEGSGFSGSMGYLRPSGLFSFTNGTSLFYGLLAPFVYYFWLHPRQIAQWLLVASTICLIAAVPLSISRGLMFSIIVSLLFVVFAGMHHRKFLGNLFIAGVGLIMVFLILSRLPFFETATEAFSSRFELANESEGGLKGVLADRYLGGMIGAVTNDAHELPFFGYGIGLGTNVGSMLVVGDTTFLISEGEWGRLIGELGILFGLLMIIVRLGLCVEISVAAYKQVSKNNVLPFILLSFMLMQVPQGQWAQPTSLGFSILIGGLTLASLRSGIERPASNKHSV